MEPRPIIPEGLAVDGQLADLCRLAVHEPEVAAELRIHLAGIEEMDDVDVEPALQQRAEPGLIARGIEEIREDDGDPRLAASRRVVCQSPVETRPPAGMHGGEEAGQGHELVAATHGGPPFGRLLAQNPHADAFQVDQADEAQRGGQSGPVIELGRATEAHGGRGVEQQVQAQILLVHEELDVQAVGAAVDVPVDVAQIVPHPVGAIVGKLHALALARTPPLALHVTPEDAARGQGQAFQLGQKV